MTKNQQTKPPKNPVRSAKTQQTFTQHLHELRRRLVWIGLALVGGAGLTYAFHSTVSAWLLEPAGDQQFIFTTPGGGFDFLLRVCLFGGLLVSLPVAVFQVLRFMQPLMPNNARRLVLVGSCVSVVLALAGIAFGYFVGLPAAMQFLLKGYAHNQISALITIQSYLSFVVVYLLGCAALFQLPLILTLVNHVKPLQPRTLFKQQRWVIIGALVLGAVVNPSPNIQDQLLLSVPLILMYHLSIALVWFLNRRKNLKHKRLATESAYELQ